jgi:hypothetical protein
MNIIDEILEVLSEGAKVVNAEADPEIEDAYSNVTVLIRDRLDVLTDPDAREAYELAVTRAMDPMTWRNPLIEAALRDLPRRHINQIHKATVILASRLPGETGIGSGEKRSGENESEDEGEVEAGA